MDGKRSPARRPSSRNAIAGSIASFFALGAPAALAANLPVTSCLDDGVGSTLRNVLLTAGNLDVVDLSGLSCPSSTITLVTGGSHLTMPNVTSGLTIKGPAEGITIDGTNLDTYYKNYSNILYHTGTGTLTLQNVTLTGGHESHKTISALGGCIYSSGSVALDNAKVQSCSAYSVYVDGVGGGIYAKGDVTLSNGSVVSGNTASSGGDNAYGGGIRAGGTVTVTASEVGGNSVQAPGNAIGGGIVTAGSVGVYFSTIDLNAAKSTGANKAAAGGGVFAHDMSLWFSQLKYNTLTSNDSALGGGAYVGLDFSSSYSTIRKNSIASSANGGGAGLRAGGNVTLANSTVSNNTSNGGYAGVDAFSLFPNGKTLLLRNSTISSNGAGSVVGGLRTNFANAKFYNSTVAFNTAASGASAPGVHIDTSSGPVSVTLQSTIMSNNTYGSNENDLGALNPMSVTFNAGPAPNLVRATFLSAQLPSGNLFGQCPLLGRLRDNGGLTETHALMSKSPAIDAGNNLLIDPGTMLPYAFDQRGSADSNGVADYPRVSGPIGGMNPKPDIGAYEVQQNDVVFNANFEGCPILF